MMENKFIGLMVGLTVGVLMVSGFLWPIVSDATATNEKFTNAGVFNYGVFTPEDEYTLNVVNATGTITVNGVTVEPFNVTNRFYSIVASENFVTRFGYSNNVYFCQCVGKDSADTTFADGGVLTTITIENGALSISYTKSDNTTISKTVEFTELYAIVPNADDAVMKIATDSVYIKEDSPIYASGLTQITIWSNLIHIEGSYEDGLTITSPNMATATFENIVWNVEPVEGFIGLYKLNSIEFDAEYEGVTQHVTYSYFGVPAEVTAEKSWHLDTTQIALVAAIGTLGAIVLIAAAAGSIRRLD